MYMSYCRFEGTLHELRACLENVDEHINEEAEYEVSEREVGRFRVMVEEFTEWLLNMQMIDEDGELDRTVLNEVCDMMRRSYEA